MFSSIGAAVHVAEVLLQRVLQTVGVLAVLGAVVYAAVLWVRRQALQSADLSVPEHSLEGKELPAKVVKVYDGDTVHVVIHMQGGGPLPPLVRYKVRLDGIDSPEMRTKNPKEKLAAVAARERLLELVAGDAQIIRFKCGKFDKYGRLLGEIFVDPFMGKADKSVNQMLIEEGHAYAYDGGTKTEFGK